MAEFFIEGGGGSTGGTQLGQVTEGIGFPLREVSDMSPASNSLVSAGYGGIGQNAIQALPDLGASWVTLDIFDTELLASPIDVVQDITNDALAFTSEGVWQISAKVSISHNELNAGREIRLRIYDVTAATAGATEFVYGVARNVGASTLIIPATLVDITSPQVGHLFAMQIGSGGDFNTVSALGSTFTVTRVSAIP